MLVCTTFTFALFYVFNHVKDLFLWPKGHYSWRITESNRWPTACKAVALANWANPPNFCLFLIVNCQLSIVNFFCSFEGFWPFVVPRRVELRTSTLSVWRSNQLSYGTVFLIDNYQLTIDNFFVFAAPSYGILFSYFLYF